MQEFLFPDCFQIVCNSFLPPQTNERTAIGELIEDVQKILYSTAEDVVVAPTEGALAEALAVQPTPVAA